MRLSSSRLARKRSLLLLLLLLCWRGFTSYRSRLKTGFSKATCPPELPLLLGIAPEISTREREAADYYLFFMWNSLLGKNGGTRSIELNRDNKKRNIRNLYAITWFTSLIRSRLVMWIIVFHLEFSSSKEWWHRVNRTSHSLIPYLGTIWKYKTKYIKSISYHSPHQVENSYYIQPMSTFVTVPVN